MSRDTVQIEELHLRIPGLTAEQGRALGEEVARRVADGLPVNGGAGRIGALDLRVTMPSGTPRDHLAGIVAERIILGLR